MVIQYSPHTCTYDSVCVCLCSINKKYFSLARTCHVMGHWLLLSLLPLPHSQIANNLERERVEEQRRPGGNVPRLVLCDKLGWAETLCAVAAVCCYFSTNWLFYWITQTAGCLPSFPSHQHAFPYFSCNVSEATNHATCLVWLYWP